MQILQEGPLRAAGAHDQADVDAQDYTVLGVASGMRRCDRTMRGTLSSGAAVRGPGTPNDGEPWTCGPAILAAGRAPWWLVKALQLSGGCPNALSPIHILSLRCERRARLVRKQAGTGGRLAKANIWSATRATSTATALNAFRQLKIVF